MMLIFGITRCDSSPSLEMQKGVFVFAPLCAVSYVVVGCYYHLNVEKPMIRYLKRKLVA